MNERQRGDDHERSRRVRRRRVGGFLAASLLLTASAIETARFVGSSDSSGISISRLGVAKPSEVRELPAEMKAFRELVHLLTGK